MTSKINRPRAVTPSTEEDALDVAEQAFIEARYQVTDEELISRINSAPDIGGATLVALSDFVSRRKA